MGATLGMNSSSLTSESRRAQYAVGVLRCPSAEVKPNAHEVTPMSTTEAYLDLHRDAPVARLDHEITDRRAWTRDTVTGGGLDGAALATRPSPRSWRLPRRSTASPCPS